MYGVTAVLTSSKNFLSPVISQLPSWQSMKNAFSSTAASFQSTPTPLRDKHLIDLEMGEIRGTSFPYGITTINFSKGVLRRSQEGQFEFREEGSSSSFTFQLTRDFNKHLKSRRSEVSYWEVQDEETNEIAYLYWNETEKRFKKYSSDDEVFSKISKDTYGAFKFVDRYTHTDTYMIDRTGFFHRKRNFEKFKSESDFLSAVKKMEERRSFWIKCAGVLAIGAVGGASVYAIHKNYNPVEAYGTSLIQVNHTNTLQAQSLFSTQTSLPLIQNVLPTMVVTEEVPFPSPPIPVWKLFGPDYAGASVSANFPQGSGLSVTTIPMRNVVTVPISPGAVGLAQKDNLVYVASSGIEVSVLDASTVIDGSNPSNVPIVNTFSVDPPSSGSRSIQQIAIEDNYLYILVTNENGGPTIFLGYGLFIYDISDDSEDPQKINYIFPLGSCHFPYVSCAPQANLNSGISIRNKILYSTTDGQTSLSFQMNDVSDPYSATPTIGSINTGKRVNYGGMAVIDDSHVVIAIGNTVAMVNTTAKSNPNFPPSSSIVFPNPVSCIIFSGNYCYVATVGAFNAIKVNFNNFSDSVVTSIPLPGFVGGLGMAIQDEICYVNLGTGHRGINVRDASKMAIVNSLFMGLPTSSGVGILGDYRCFTHSTGLTITPGGNQISFNGPAAGGFKGIYPVILSAIQNGTLAQGMFNLVIQPAVKLAKAIPEKLIAVVNAIFSYFLDPNTFSQVNKSPLKNSVTCTDPALQFNLNTLELFSPRPLTKPGVINCTATAMDPAGASNSTAFQVGAYYGPTLNPNKPFVTLFATVGQDFSFTYDQDAILNLDGNPLTVQATTIPNGFTFNSVTRTLSGKFSQAGINPITYLATDPITGITLPVNFQISVAVPASVSDSYTLADLWQVIKTYVLPTFSVLGLGYGLSKKWGLCYNVWFQKYGYKQLENEPPAIAGEYYIRKLSPPELASQYEPHEVKKVRALMTVKKVCKIFSFCSFSYNAEIVEDLPFGSFYHNKITHSIESDRVPDPRRMDQWTIQVLGAGDKILEQYKLNIVPAQAADALYDTKSMPAGVFVEKPRRSTRITALVSRLQNLEVEDTTDKESIELTPPKKKNSGSKDGSEGDESSGSQSTPPKGPEKKEREMSGLDISSGAQA